MLTINVRMSPEQALAYYQSEFLHGDYYAEGGNTPGRWLGQGAEMLGLTGEVDQQAYEHLCYNRLPSGLGDLSPRTRE
ncbi:MAG TPA: relaxase domain-containing protein, partial [Phycisphaerales bacterium]|nr:relaxase domain-containing protein [Phycisphaerales bacterium]